MSYLNLHRTDADDLTDPISSLNNNWDQIDSKFKALDTGSNIPGTGVVSPQTSLESVSSQISPPPVGVYTGSGWVTINTTEVWGSWTNLTLQTNFNSVSGRTAQIRVSNLGRAQLRGAVQYLTGTTAWPAGYNIVNDGQLAASNYAPQQTSVMNTASVATLSTTWAYGQIFVSFASGFLKFWLMYRGTTLGSGNFISLDGIGWFIN